MPPDRSQSRNSEESMRDKGYRWGQHFKKQGIDYGLDHGHYPSCLSMRAVIAPEDCDYCKGYEEGFNEA